MGSVHGRYENKGSPQRHSCYELRKTDVTVASSLNELHLAQPSTASQQALQPGCGGCSRKLFRKATAAHPTSRAFSSCTISDALISKHTRQASYRYMTRWHRPTTNSIFSSHFKDSNRNEQFDVHHLVAKGAFGVVFKVCERLKSGDINNVSYALKVIKKSKIIAENSLQQIKDEVDIQKLCSHHPFIVKQIDTWQNRRNLHISPEIINHKPYNHAVDWWALGVIVCQMLTHKSPNIIQNVQLQHQENSNLGEDLRNAPSAFQINGYLVDKDSTYFMPKKFELLSYEEQDLIRRLLVLEPQQRIRSVMSLQRIALYKDYKIETKRLMNISPLDIITRDKIRVHEDNSYELFSIELADKAFQDF
ncbi:serine/threonine-protein kinase S6KL isoform X2 [Drosophila innubila]|uniref:serine/threonine-protein kinase S6KL isoform X2 n=1 Tax=Drosophila innubila TaxID=198719 RepID=UPI00148CFEE5|nr:serine/threonine-protein kinase S6KL isoform X2 [Drosophila innubila]